ncbi:MAG: hypothetical protein M3535_11095 [Actinomycetota bacterium]|jgi:hypothetical protein|nr:hypothetical protein [Actinomycetota bacterium]
MDLLNEAPVIAAQVWTYWIGVPLAVGGVLLTVATVAGYLKKVQALKYPRNPR